ncbi:hypothetical protein L9F63_017010 [Diploptera punctata]|uniref:non-specific protein-tyrosine kinase n=1 Tax=Diploptera punctata TaxID=6984 RepID=A0AAD8EGM2_DIPPU|nr:hypothetical protein L9F63_017010 [Diploptera punctata]
MSSARGPGLYEFLIEAELQQYYAGIKNDLKVQNVPQLKYVTEDDLHAIGMSRPEMRRLKNEFCFTICLIKQAFMILPRKEEQVSMLAMLPDEAMDKPPIRVPNKHIIPAESIIVNKELGTGEFGVVQQGVWTNDGERIQVAIKCLSREHMQNNPIEFLKEAAIMHAIDHEHIVRLYGVVLDTNALMLVTELAPLRSLLECLKEPSLRASFPVLSLCDFAIQICDGMQYLEMKRLIHRDLAARNILVFSKNKVKISDFGLSRALGVGKDYYQTNFNVNLKLPIAWCAPECISYLRFTSASDVWAYGVTLWEMFSYGFQPWAALTGHQILEAIDEPNFQRLEQPECCPKEYFSVMLKCWQHDPNKRPRFADLINILPECKPEQVQAVQDLAEDPHKLKPREQLVYRVGDVITVLDKGPFPNMANYWKGVLNNGKTGLFNPVCTVAYLGSNLPSNKSEFVRGDGKNAYSSRRRLRPDMISSPQGDFKHTSHVGLDGAYFGDISFLGGKYHHLPRQVVTPYKPQDDSDHTALARTSSDASSDRAPLLTGSEPNKLKSDVSWSDSQSDTQVSQTASGSGAKVSGPKFLLDHEYHEISDEEGAVESPRFEKSFDFGPSLLDEMDAVFRSLGGSPPPPPSPGLSPPPASPLDETINVRNELREMAAKVTTNKKKQATVKPISAADQRTLDCAIAMANELTARSMSDLDNGTPPESPHTPGTPGKRKFSFRFPTPAINKHNSPKLERKTFSEEFASIRDIQSSLSPEAKEVYSSLVEQPLPSSPSLDTNPLRMLRSGAFPVVRPKVRGNKHVSGTQQESRSLPRLRVPPPPSSAPPPIPRISPTVVSNPITELTEDVAKVNVNTSDRSDDEEVQDENPIPLPPRDRSRPMPPTKPRHQRKHPLIIPGGGVSRTLAKMSEAELEDAIIEEMAPHYLGVEAQPQTVLPTSEDVCSEPDRSPPRTASLDDSFEQRIAHELAALDDIPTTGGEMIRHSDHVSCEDLLEFACDAPNARRTQGKARGVDSDEVRIMGKVLGPEVSAECCIAALNVSNWDVHRAIKVARLHNLLQVSADSEIVNTDFVSCNEALEACGWDVARAASWVLAQEQGDTTQV